MFIDKNDRRREVWKWQDAPPDMGRKLGLDRDPMEFGRIIKMTFECFQHICECQQHKFAIYLFLCASSFVKYVFVDQNSPDILRFALGQFPRKNHSLILRFAEPRFVLKWPEHDLPQPLLLNPKKGEERTGSLNSSTTL